MTEPQAVLEGAERWCVIHGDCLTELRKLPDNSVDSVLTDPPYGLGTREPTVDEIKAYLDGADLDTGGDFMGRKWFMPSVSVWREVYRVLKPGGHVAAFGGTRTYDLISLGLRAAGFEMRDAIEVFSGPVHFVYGVGFPKSLNVSAAIDEHFGAEREVVGPVAKQWDGWQTALKPAHEPALLFRKPLEGTVAANILKHGTGALNVGACRVESGTDYASLSVTQGVNGSRTSYEPRRERRTFVPSSGRFPPNVLLVHGSGCTDAQCVPGCPVRLMGEQSGESESKASYGRNGNDTAAATYGLRRTEDQLRGHSDSGTAARFFPTFFYSGKASRAEREAGCERLPAYDRTDITGRDDDSAGQNHPRSGSRREGEIRNTHPCVKPIALLKWLATLITPPGGTVLVPYAGSGSECAAAVAAGFRAIGIELDPDDDGYCDIARARIAWWQEHPGGLTAASKAEARAQAAGQLSLLEGTR